MIPLGYHAKPPNMKKIHIAIGVSDIARSVAGYSKRLGCQPAVVVPNEYALWLADQFLHLCAGCASGV